MYEQKPRSVTSVLTLYVIIVKIVHEYFRQLQHYETSVHGFSLHNCLFGELDHDDIVVYISDIFGGRFRQGLFKYVFDCLLVLR